MFGLIPRQSQDRVTNFFNDNFLNEDFLGTNWLNLSHVLNNELRIDVREDEQAYTIEADLPGVHKEEIGLDYDNGTLYITVNHQEENHDDQQGYVHRERRSLSMQRGIYVGDIDIQGIDAELKEGVLHLVVPKTTASNNQYRIEIH